MPNKVSTIALGALLITSAAALAAPDSAPAYRRISPTLEGETIVLTGRDLTVDQVVRVASLEEVLSAKAYLCFYERITEAPPTPSPDSNRKK